VSLALVAACTLTTVIVVALLLFTIYSNQTIKQSIFYSNDNHRHVCMRACMQMTFQFHTLSECMICGMKWSMKLLKTSVVLERFFNK
jgi:hypothetical protein